MKLGVSNLAWPAAETDAALNILAAEGAAGVEAAPTRIADWDSLTPARLRDYRAACAARGLAISSLQAIFYGCRGLALLGPASDFAAMADHMRRVAEIAETLGASVAVFGAPGCRLRGAMPVAEANALAAERLRVLGDIAAPAGLTIGMEPVPARYGADFLNHAAEVVALAQACGHPAIGTHLDTACVTLAGDDPAAAIRLANGGIVHYHAAEPDLAGFETPHCDHAAAGSALRAVGYDKWLVIEMREVPSQSPIQLRSALRFVLKTYIRQDT